MTTLLDLIKLLYPFLQEFGLKEINIKKFIVQNKTISYLLMICFLLFTLQLYALEQAHTRMLNRPIFLEKQKDLQIIINERDAQIEQLELMCMHITHEQNGVPDKDDVDSVLVELMGTTANEK